MVHEINVYLGKRLRRRRLLLGLSQNALAVAVGVRFQQIQKYECAANSMSAARLWQLSEALDVPVTYFFDDAESTYLAEQIALVTALGDGLVRQIAERAFGLSDGSLEAILAMVENTRKLEELPESAEA